MPLIINIRGTSGSGKTTLMTLLIAALGTKKEVFQEGRKRPLLYLFEQHKVVVLGHYDKPCGGCDSIPDVDHVFDLVRHYHRRGYTVLFEGLLIAADVKHITALNQEFPGAVRVVALNTPLDVCISSINARRAARDATLPPVKTANTESKYKGVIRSMERLTAETSIDARWASREKAYTTILGWLNLPNPNTLL